LLLADPFTFDAEALIAGLDAAYPKARKIGGMASGGKTSGSNRLFLREDTWRSGTVGVALMGDLRVDSVVAQGCRPIGTPQLVTRAQGHLIQELGGRPPVEVLRELHGKLSAEEQELFGNSLFCGIEMKSNQVEFRPGELLARNVVGIDPKTGAIAIGADVKPYQPVQFLIRDARTATEDLSRQLEHYREENGGASASGALLFQCLGRGENLFGRPDHDTGLFQLLVGRVPLGGFFCNGEIGPVGGTTFLHGYTSSFAIFSPK
jgi:small ligand-binding sensory domain FIST